MWWRSILTSAIIAVLYPYLSDVGHSLKVLVTNAPGKLPEVADFRAHQVRFADHMRNCEDVALDNHHGLAIVSCSPGRDQWNTVMGRYIDSSEHGTLYLYRYGSAPDDPPTLIPLDGFDAPFHPLGLAYHNESHTLAVTNHGGEHATVEMFTLDPDAPRASHRRTIADPFNLPTPNSLVFLNRTHLYASNTHRTGVFTKPTTLLDRLRVWLMVFELRIGVPTGSVSLIDLTTGTATRVLSLGFANGIDLLDNGQTLAVASSIKAAVYLYDMSAHPPQPRFLHRIKVPFFPDNLSVDSRGFLLVAGHPHPPSLGIMVRNNWQCHSGPHPAKDCFRAPSWVVEWDPAKDGKPEDALRSLYVGSNFASSTGAVHDVNRNVLVVSGLYEQGLLVAQM